MSATTIDAGRVHQVGLLEVLVVGIGERWLGEAVHVLIQIRALVLVHHGEQGEDLTVDVLRNHVSATSSKGLPVISFTPRGA
jgi:hypothetical protein